MTDPTFDPMLYTRPPVLTLESGIALCRALRRSMPRGASAAIRKAGDKLERLADAAQQALARRQHEDSGYASEDHRNTDPDTDRAWRILVARLAAYAQLPTEGYPKAARAAELQQRLGTGLNEYLSLPYAEQLVAMDTVLSRIDDEGLAKDLNALCGPEFLDNARTCQSRYRRMVESRMQDPGASDKLNLHVRAMGRAVVEYALRILASIDDEEAGSQEAALAALLPIDNHRESLARRSSGNGKAPAPEPEPSGPAAPAPAGP